MENIFESINFKNLLSCYSELASDIIIEENPSTYFHKRALTKKKNNFLSNNHIEMIYATLVSWGMHRMGGNTRMGSYIDFKSSILKHQNELETYKSLNIENIKNIDNVAKVLSEICFDFQVMITNKTKIVGCSKTLAHILPDIVPPMDKRYTILFFTRKSDEFYNRTNNSLRPPKHLKTIEEEKEMFKKIICMTHEFAFEFKENNKKLIDKIPIPKYFDSLIRKYVQNKQKIK